MAPPGPYTLGELARAIGAALEGDPGRVIAGVAPLETAGPDQISFLTHPKYLSLAKSSRAGALLVPENAVGLPGPLLRSGVPQRALIALIRLFHPAPPIAPGIHPAALVAPAARVHPEASVGAYSVVEGGAVVGRRARIFPMVYVGAEVEVGEEAILYPHVVIREGVRVGRRVIIHPGAVIGADGFGYAFDGTVHQKIPQVGGVVLEDDVEVGANVTIDRATLGDTVIRRGTKVDNLVQIAHNVQIGEDVIVVAQTGISGSCSVGNRAVLAGQVGLADHVTVGEGVRVGAKSGVNHDLDPGQSYFGYPARPVAEARRIYGALPRLPELLKRMRALEQRLGQLERRLDLPAPGAGEDDAR
jgi:UDP-3-O-[3-hydroxymyristoyl] glucosamine N-acyltransferase